MGTMAQGFAFGTGSSIARGAVGAAGDALFGGSSEQAAQPAAQQAAAAPAAQDACAVDKRAFYQCLETSNGDADKCDLGVPLCRDAFTPSTRLVSISRCRGSFRFRG